MSEPGDVTAARSRFRRSLSGDVAARLSGVGKAAQDASERTSGPAGEPNGLSERGIVASLQARLIDHLRRHDLLGADEEAVRAEIDAFVLDVLATESFALNEDERAHLAEELVEEALGMGPLAPLMADPAVTDILVNGADQVYVERFGRLERAPVRFRDDEHVLRIIDRLASRIGRRIDQSWPMVDLRLADGSRVNATIPPAALDGPTISIRRFGLRRLRKADLLRLGSISEAMMGFLDLAVQCRRNVLISGGTGAGKSTLLGVLAEAIPEDDRIVTIEDTAELELAQPHVVRLETRPPNTEGRGEITARDLVINALRMRPTRIILGEVRGAEALDMLQAMNTGHEGGLSTIHANSSRDALARLETMVLFAGTDLPSRAIREQITSAIHLIVQVRRYEDGARRVERISEVTGLEGQTPLVQDLFVFHVTSRSRRRVEGRFEATGIVPRFVEEAREAGLEVDPSMFSRPGLGD